MDQPINATVAETMPAERKPYSTPTLTDFGSFAEITQGAVNVGADIGIYS
ncbi:MAG TPA: lasso RiPP family leader peptide-containing protein [Thermoanaerobaculia bacterium]